MLKITLISSDNVIITTNLKAALLSETFHEMLSHLGVDLECGSNELIPVSNVPGAVLQKVIEWCEHHQEDQRKESIDVEAPMADWDKEFFNVDNETIFAYINAANYLNIKGMMNLACQTVANKLAGRKDDEIRKLFDMENDLAPEEDDYIHAENRWLQE